MKLKVEGSVKKEQCSKRRENLVIRRLKKGRREKRCKNDLD